MPRESEGENLTLEQESYIFTSNSFQYCLSKKFRTIGDEFRLLALSKTKK